MPNFDETYKIFSEPKASISVLTTSSRFTELSEAHADIIDIPPEVSILNEKLGFYDCLLISII